MAPKAGKKSPGRPFARLRRLALITLAVLLLPVLAYWTLGLLIYRFVEPPATPLMVIRSIERVHLPWRDPAPLESIARSLALSVVVAEDSGFCLHHGIDLDAVEDAVGDYVNKGRVRGASTITMQVARNLFLWPGGGAAGRTASGAPCRRAPQPEPLERVRPDAIHPRAREPHSQRGAALVTRSARLHGSLSDPSLRGASRRATAKPDSGRR